MRAVCGVAIPYFMFTRQEHSIEKMTAVWLLPIVACRGRRGQRRAAGAASGALEACSSSFSAMCCGHVRFRSR